MKVKWLWFSFFITPLSYLLILICQSDDPSFASRGVIKIGFAAPLTGDQAQIGIETLNGVKLAVEQANEKGEVIPGYKFEVYALDDQHNPSQAVIVARIQKKFMSQRNRHRIF